MVDDVGRSAIGADVPTGDVPQEEVIELHARRGSRWIGGAGFATALAAGMVLAPVSAFAQAETGPSDSRADFLEGNIQSCAEGGYSAADGFIELAGQNTETADDGLVRVTGGTVPDPPPPEHEESKDDYTGINVEILPDGEDMGVVVDAVFVKASTDTNRYTSPHTPPELNPDQWYIGPLLHPGENQKIADVSHYNVCYHFEMEPPDKEKGSLSVAKSVLAGNGVETPESYEATVECSESGTFQVTFGSGGGLGTFEGGGKTLDDLEDGETCTVTETEPAGAAVSYEPSQTVTIEKNKIIMVTIVNDFGEAPPGKLTILKEAAKGQTDEKFTIEYDCQDPDSPLTGEVELAPGESETIEPISADAFCTVIEPSEGLPEGWVLVGYEIQGGHELILDEDDNPTFRVAAGSEVTVIVKNEPTADQVVAPTPKPQPSLPVTGGGPWLLIAAAGLIAAGIVTLLIVRRTRSA